MRVSTLHGEDAFLRLPWIIKRGRGHAKHRYPSTGEVGVERVILERSDSEKISLPSLRNRLAVNFPASEGVPHQEIIRPIAIEGPGVRKRVPLEGGGPKSPSG